MKKIFALTLLALLSLSTAQAGIIAAYNVSNYNNGTAAHGLYTFGDYSPQTFTIDALFLIFQDDNTNELTASLSGTLSNANHAGSLDLFFSNWQDNYAYKVEGGANNGGINADYFVDISGTITIDNVDFAMGNCVPCGYAFQYGLGANAKNANEIGASAWIQHRGQNNTQHWDLNLAFSAVPEPSMLMLMSLGLFALGFKARRKS